MLRHDKIPVRIGQPLTVGFTEGKLVKINSIIGCFYEQIIVNINFQNYIIVFMSLIFLYNYPIHFQEFAYAYAHVMF